MESGVKRQKRVDLILATGEDAELLHRLQVESFLPLYEKYHDDETSPVKETLEKTTRKIVEPGSDFYLISFEGEPVGGVCVKRHHRGETVQGSVWISPIFVIPAFQNRGIAQRAIERLFALYPDAAVWRLETIEQESGNCHLYEKCGFVRDGTREVVNERMTLVGYEKR